MNQINKLRFKIIEYLINITNRTTGSRAYTMDKDSSIMAKNSHYDNSHSHKYFGPYSDHDYLTCLLIDFVNITH